MIRFYDKCLCSCTIDSVTIMLAHGKPYLMYERAKIISKFVRTLNKFEL